MDVVVLSVRLDQHRAEIITNLLETFPEDLHSRSLNTPRLYFVTKTK